MVPVDYTWVAALDAPHEDLCQAAKENIKSDDPVEPFSTQSVAQCQHIESYHDYVDRVGDLRAGRFLRRTDQASLTADNL